MKGISTPVLVTIIVIVIAAVALLVNQLNPAPPPSSPQDTETAQEETDQEEIVEEGRQPVEFEEGVPFELTTCSSNADCEEKMYCAKANCSDTTGSCALKPEVCASVYEPVCGCDDVTYSNSCNAWQAGVNVSKQGSCSFF